VESCTVTNTGSTNATPSATTGGGISVSSGSTVRDCTVAANKGDGILATFDCLITGNEAVSNGSSGDGAGIHTTGSNNRIESNHVNFNDRGIDVDSTASVIIGNTASGNTTNYVIALSNRYGPIVNITATGTAAVSGSSAASTMTTTDPTANYAH
jgi:parallel beta-helix repeat protein